MFENVNLLRTLNMPCSGSKTDVRAVFKSGSGCRQKVAILVFVSEVMHVNFNYKLRYVCPYRGKKKKENNA